MKTQEMLRQMALERVIQLCAEDELDINFQIEQMRIESEFETFINTLPIEQKNALETLLLEDVVRITKIYRQEDKRGKPHIWMIVNDTFVPAADAEDILPEELPEILKIYQLYEWHGIIAWVSLKRDQRPMKGTIYSAKCSSIIEEIKRLRK